MRLIAYLFKIITVYHEYLSDIRLEAIVILDQKLIITQTEIIIPDGKKATGKLNTEFGCPGIKNSCTRRRLHDIVMQLLCLNFNQCIQWVLLN